MFTSVNKVVWTEEKFLCPAQTHSSDMCKWFLVSTGLVEKKSTVGYMLVAVYVLATSKVK